MEPDFRYRDMCIMGAPLEQDDFDPATGGINAPTANDVWAQVSSSSSSSLPSSSSSASSPPPSLFDPYYVGRVNGAKPPLECMPMRDTPRVQIDDALFDNYYNAAFAYFMNMDDAPFTYGSTGSAYDPYKGSDYYRSKTFFIGNDQTVCPDILTFNNDWFEDTFPDPNKPETIPERAKLHRKRADWCYNYFILNHSFYPWFVMERPEGGTDDPLSVFDPDLSFLNNCQPLVNGYNASVSINGATNPNGILYREWYPKPQMSPIKLEKQSGFAPVWQYRQRPDMDEAEYLLSDYLKKTWDENFDPPKTDNTWDTGNVKGYFLGDNQQYRLTTNMPYPHMGSGNQPIPIPQACVQECTPGSNDPRCTPWPTPVYECVAPPQPEQCPSTWKAFKMPSDYPAYSSTGGEDPYYCPNVEKIIDPRHPFSPRDDMLDSYNDNAFVKHYYDAEGYYSSTVRPYPNVLGYPHRLTDRDYSMRTSILVPPNTTCDTKKHLGYSDYNAITPWVDDQGNAQDARHPEPGWQVRNPAVQCAVVPVDILPSRAKEFDKCIMQRINWNYKTWLQSGGAVDMRDPDFTFDPPCKTRFWETDDITRCPVRLTIQQCCHIIVKDVVPANFLKLRLEEGLMQNRRYDAPLQTEMNELVQELTAFGFPQLPADPSSPDLDNPPVKVNYLLNDPQIISGYYPNANAYNMGSLGNNEMLYQYAVNGSIQTNRVRGYDTEPKEYQFGKYFDKFVLPPEYYPSSAPDCSDGSRPPCTDDPLYDYKVGGFVGYHMPYMRWWDTGAAAGNFHHGGDFVNTLGGFDTLIGVGREERDETDADRMNKKLRDINQSSGPAADIHGPDVRERLSEPQPAEMGRIGGWSELKAHEMWTIRRSNLFCMGRYEKLFKAGGPEQLVLSKAGAGYTSVGDRNADPVIHPAQWPWSLGWRGYITDTHGISQNQTITQFPHFPGGADNESVIEGLDNALPGDIIYYSVNDTAHLAYVTDVGFDEANRKNTCFDYTIGKFRRASSPNEIPCDSGQIITPNRVFVVSWDQGKFPTATGSTLEWGTGPQRTIYKKTVPQNYSAEICGRRFRALIDTDPAQFRCDEPDPNVCPSAPPDGCQPSCEDSNYSACVLPSVDGEIGWDKARIFRPYFDVRQCTGTISYPPNSPSNNFNLQQTYDWTGWSGDPTNTLKPIPQVIYQSKTSLVNSDLWGYCVNAGYDPPAHWTKEYRGPQTGAMTDTTLCGARWWECPAPPGTDFDFFPKGN